MCRTAIVLLLLTAPILAQVEVAPNQLPRLLREFESHPGDTPLRCDVTPLAPVLNFAFRFQAGYTFHVPQAQYPGPIQGWSELTIITPEDGIGKSTYLLSRHQLAEASRSDLTFDLNGLYLLGAGAYSVESAVRDDRNRICRKQWRIVAKSTRADRPVQSALPPFAVRPISSASWLDTQNPDAGSPQRISVLLNAAAFSTKRSAIRPTDRLVLVQALTALLEHLPTESVRLSVFSLEQQREIFRSDDFSLRSMSKVNEAISALQLATVDVQVLQKPLGHVGLLTGLINRELQAEVPVDTVVFLGPPSRYENKIPADALRRPSSPYPRFFYLQYQGPRRVIIPPGFTDDPGLSGGRGGGKAGGPTQPTEGGPDYPDPSSNTTSSSPPRLPSQNGSSSSSSSGSNSGAGTGTGTGTNNTGTSSSGTMGSSAGRGGGTGGRGGRNLPPMSEPVERNSDIINSAVGRLKGKTLVLHSPAELAKAIRKIEQKR